jgi:hypothetical protein
VYFTDCFQWMSNQYKTIFFWIWGVIFISEET